MPDKKLTDSEIIKALPFLAKYCKKEYNDIKVNEVLLGSFDLINRLQAKLDEAEDTIQFAYKELKKAEVEIKTELDKLNAEKNDVMYHKAQIKAEAIKEFAERLKDMHKHNTTSVVSLVTVFDNINNLVKELIGE